MAMAVTTKMLGTLRVGFSTPAARVYRDMMRGGVISHHSLLHARRATIELFFRELLPYMFVDEQLPDFKYLGSICLEFQAVTQPGADTMPIEFHCRAHKGWYIVMDPVQVLSFREFLRILATELITPYNTTSPTRLFKATCAAARTAVEYARTAAWMTYFTTEEELAIIARNPAHKYEPLYTNPDTDTHYVIDKATVFAKSVLAAGATRASARSSNHASGRATSAPSACAAGAALSLPASALKDADK